MFAIFQCDFQLLLLLFASFVIVLPLAQSIGSFCLLEVHGRYHHADRAEKQNCFSPVDDGYSKL